MKLSRAVLLGFVTCFLVSPAFAKGPGSGTGGNLLADEPPTPVHIEFAIEAAKERLLPYVFNFLEVEWGAYGREVHSKAFADIGDLLFGKGSGQDVFAKLAESHFRPKNEDCLDRDGNHRDASVGNLGDREICFSIERIAAGTTVVDVNRKVLILALHEMVHRMGGNEDQAVWLAKFLNSRLLYIPLFEFENMVRNVFWERVVRLNYFATKQLQALATVKHNDKSSVNKFCEEFNRAMRSIDVPSHYVHSGWMGMAPLRLSAARTVFLIEQKFDLDELFCGGSSDRRATIQKWFGSHSTMTPQQYATAKNIPFTPAADGTLRKPVLGDLKALSEELSDFYFLTDMLLKWNRASAWNPYLNPNRR